MSAVLVEPTVRPRIDTAPEVEHSDGPLAVEMAADVGLDLDDWQRYALDRTLGRRPTSSGWRWAARECGLVVPRQSGKGAILEARALHGLWVVGERLITWTAHEYKTAKEAFYRVEGLLGGESHRDVKKVRYGNDEKSIELHSGQRLIFLARTPGSGRGFTGDCVIFDEAYKLDDKQLEALFSTLAARPDPQVWYASMGGLVDSHVLARVRDRGIEGDERLAYLEWSAHPNADRDDRKVWRGCNPGMPHRITEEFVEDERRTLSDDGFARERLCIWDSSTSTSVIPTDTWANLEAKGSKPKTRPVAFAVDAPPELDSASIAVAGLNQHGRLHVELVDERSGTGWIAERFAELVRKWRPCGAALDPAAPIGGTLNDIRQALARERLDLEIDLVSGREMAQACGFFYRSTVIERSTVHIGQPELTAAVDAGRKRTIGDAWVWHRRDTESNIAPLVAVTLAAHELAKHGWYGKGRSSKVKRLR